MDNKKIILVLESDLDTLSAIREKLEERNYEVVPASSIDQLRNYFNDSIAIDVIWLNNCLLAQHGYAEFIKNIRQEDSAWSKVPLFIVSDISEHSKISPLMGLDADRLYDKDDYRLENVVSDLGIFLKSK